MRYLQAYVERDLLKKMVLIGGPKQSGKKTLAQSVMKPYDQKALYLDWDKPRHRQALLARRWQTANKLIVLGELHKYAPWKSWLKEIYDARAQGQNFLVTASARFDVDKPGGDLMIKRYQCWRLHPFCLAELPSGMDSQTGFVRLMKVEGFPKPFLKGDENFARHWQCDRLTQIIQEDVRELEQLQDLHSLTLLVQLLQRCVGQQVVVANLAQKLEIADKTVKKWLSVLERVYLLFAVLPFHRGIARALSKQPKIYFFNNLDVVGSIGNRFENLVATHLLKRLHFLEDSTGHAYTLRYIRDREKREVDFVVLKNGEVDTLVEAQWADDKPSTSLKYFTRLLKPRCAFQVVGTLDRSYDRDGIKVRSAQELFSTLEGDLE